MPKSGSGKSAAVSTLESYKNLNDKNKKVIDYLVSGSTIYRDKKSFYVTSHGNIQMKLKSTDMAELIKSGLIKGYAALGIYELAK